MSLSGDLIFYTYDPYGELRVLDDGITRTLSFGCDNEQSACLKQNPAMPIFEYTQTMLLSLLFLEPRRVLCLGLGAGSLLNVLHKHFKACKFTIVELRQAVIDIAESYFYLPAGKRVQKHCLDAKDFVAEDTTHYDLIFSDIYTEEGVAELQLQAQFLYQTAARLKPRGILVINCWCEHQRDQRLLGILERLFVSVYACPTGDGNWIVFASNSYLENQPKTLKEKAESLSQRLGFSLERHLKRLTKI